MMNAKFGLYAYVYDLVTFEIEDNGCPCHLANANGSLGCLCVDKDGK